MNTSMLQTIRIGQGRSLYTFIFLYITFALGSNREEKCVLLVEKTTLGLQKDQNIKRQLYFCKYVVL